MARQLRLEFEGAFYHITSRGNLREKIFFVDQDREMFLDILKRTKERYGYFLHAYALMDNHYHLLVETPKANVSQIMQNINTSYTVYINRKFQRNGHLFQGRFKALLVDKDEYLVAVSRYIHLNPVRAKLVQHPANYPWTSYNAYTGRPGKHAVVDTADTFAFFSNFKGQAQRAYRAFVEIAEGREENPFKNTEAGTFLGGQRYKKKILKLLKKMKSDEELPQIKRLREHVSIASIINAGSSFYGKKEDDFLTRGKNKRERKILIYLSKVLGSKKNKEIGISFGIKGPAVSGAIKTIEQELGKNIMLKKELENLKEKILNEK